jgi:microcystin-dependent protein
MAVDNYMSEIQIFAFPFAPRNWAQCNGQTIAISTNQALFSLLGTSFGGDGVTTFKLPDLRGRTAISNGILQGGRNYSIGQSGGEETHSLLIGETPAHSHVMQASALNADLPNADGNLLAMAGSGQLFSTGQTSTPMANNLLTSTGNGTGHNNMQPYLVLNYCICLYGIFPSRN